MYPGVILQNLIGPALVDGRAKLIENKKAKRAIIQTNDAYRNKIDTLFVDQRNKVRTTSQRFASLDQLNERGSYNDSASNGNYLVVCCDGNASFYEVGIFSTPIEKGYSTLGWNYPGFGESTVRDSFLF